MFVAVYEARFHVRLEGIIRNPQHEHDYAQNAQLVINALSEKIHIGLHHISGMSIAQGDRKGMSNLVRIFLHLVSTAGLVLIVFSTEAMYICIEYFSHLSYSHHCLYRIQTNFP